MRRRVLFVSLAALGGAACGGQSSGGGGVDAAIDSGADSGAVAVDAARDSGGNDAGIDGSEPDATLGDAQADAEEPDAADASEDAGCTSGALRCVLDTVETCSNGSWGAPVPCPASAPACSAGVCGQPPSCQGGDGMTCGADGGESCCTSLEVTGGTFYRTYTIDDAGAPGGEADPATVSSFRLDKYLVTVGRFRAFMDAWNGGAGFRPSEGSGKHVHLNGGLGLAAAPNVDGGQTYEPGWSAADDPNVVATEDALTNGCGGDSVWATLDWNRRQPINCVNWWEAYAFCIWDGAFLPSDAEWGYAAAGGSEQREYPWGATDPGTANQYAIFGSGSYCNYPHYGQCTGQENIAPVGTASLGAGAWGQLDLAGEVYEWSLDWSAPYASPCADCGGEVATSMLRVARGSVVDQPLTTPSARFPSPPAIRIGGIGFRCARTP